MKIESKLMSATNLCLIITNLLFSKNHDKKVFKHEGSQKT